MEKLEMAHKTFGKPKPVDTDVEPITFDVADEEGIKCRPSVNGKLLITLVGKVDSGNITLQSEGILEVFGVCVLTNDGENPDDYSGKPLDKHTESELEELAEEDVTPGIDPTSSLGRLNRVLDDPDTPVSIDELAEMVGWLVEQYTARPGKAKSTNSSNGTKNTKRTSRRGQRSTDLTSVPSTSE
jgi:hypothetical protein